MSQTVEEPGEETPAEAGETSERTELVAKAVLIAVALLASWGLVAALPEIAYVVTGILICLGWQKARAWLGRHGDDNQDQEPEDAGVEVDVAAALRELAVDIGGSVLLTALRDKLKLPDTKKVKELLDEADIPWKAVRTPTGNGPGVHMAHIPPAPSPPAEPHGHGCCCRSEANTNADNPDQAPPGEGLRVERTDSGFTVYDLSDTERHHQVNARGK